MDAEFLRRVAETEYATLDPEYTRPVRFGTFYSHPSFPDRYDANQLCRVSCSEADVPELLQELDEYYRGLDLSFREASGYEGESWVHLGPMFRSRGWEVWTSKLLLLRESSTRTSNRSVDIRSVPPHSPDLETLYREGGVLNRGFELARSQFGRMGGEYLVGHLEGQPACTAGWCAVHDVQHW